jgi:hypothetical protein
MHNLMGLLLLMTLAACSSTSTLGVEQWRALQAEISSVSVVDGISSMEANSIAEGYLISYVSACGVAHDVTDGGDSWISRTAVGVAAAPGRDIRISKATGEVSSMGLPTVSDPRSIRVLPPNTSLERTRER